MLLSASHLRKTFAISKYFAFSLEMEPLRCPPEKKSLTKCKTAFKFFKAIFNQFAGLKQEQCSEEHIHAAGGSWPLVAVMLVDV